MKNNYSHQDLIINLNTGTGKNSNDNLDFTLNLKNNIMFIDSFPTPSLTESNSVNLDTVSQNELNSIMDKIKISWDKIYSENRTLFDLF